MSWLVAYNGWQAEAVPVVSDVKYTKVQREVKVQNEKVWILLAVSTSFYCPCLTHSFTFGSTLSKGYIIK